MTLVYLRLPEHDLITQIAGELVDAGMAKKRIHAYSVHPRRMPSAPVQVTRYLSPSGAVATGSAMGAFAGALVGVPFLALGGLGIAPLLVLMVTGGMGGAVFRLWIGNGPGGELYRFDEVLKSGEVVMVLESDAQQVSEIQDKIKARYPEVSVLRAAPWRTLLYP